ncbi:hypothetical protein ES319_A08G059000v1 [Gossypium barbadense]|uniref:Uncharacterized protein n=1 Tax=Gossypium barbadense TaxID=3634 RepID=A0A5J5UMK7_GOSBA|nr:hypothetical protein ES319_A08G059000v1 [Gossypium barbadense]
MKVFISAIQFFLRKILSNLGIFSIVLPSSNGRGLGLLLTVLRRLRLRKAMEHLSVIQFLMPKVPPNSPKPPNLKPI